MLSQAQHRATGKGEGQTNHITPLKPRALQQRPPSAAGAVRAEDAFVLEDGRDARELSTTVLARVQSTDLGAAQKTQTILSHYPGLIPLPEPVFASRELESSQGRGSFGTLDPLNGAVVGPSLEVATTPETTPTLSKVAH